MIELSAALAAMALAHWVPSAPRVRPILISVLGPRGFHAVYSLVSFGVLVWLVAAYGAAADGPWLWTPPFWARWTAVLGMPVALWLILARLMQRPGDAPASIYRLTATPGSLGILLWAGLHLLNVGAARAVVLFGTFAVIALAAAVKNLWTAPPGRRLIGILPGRAMLQGRTPARLDDLPLTPLVLAFGLWLALLALHPLVIGADPLAGMLP
ncbi:MAG: hypothetical protein COW30_13105 [Rhodospirillales bacterium CG15_BIG_FIL_POST_REV_8_21_14_020_66_15]|nr:MAG: hypothetical protein COW30_13105 [Rhodospirillales bacterium CG15_BIG_FIL_POST_REV_8_21_14_020_66_15]